QPSESKLSLNAAKAEDHEFDLSLITSSKDKKNNIYLCIKGSFRKEENGDTNDFLVSPNEDTIDFLCCKL
ncbi:hypothetical protein ACMSEF_00005, partial [Bacteroides thetaiotaomicron]|uniref:hypothetical protein n=1 Tax=Bacteroides thetaiotaomicron TaxID=818 RepID=UPI0039C1542B